MKVSVCITVLNEKKSVVKLINALLNQSKKPTEVVIVDGGSTDGTIPILSRLASKNPKIRLLTKKCTRSRGRNIGVNTSKNEIIAITGADCIPSLTWLENLVEPYDKKSTEVVAGFYEVQAKDYERQINYERQVNCERQINWKQKVFAMFLGVLNEHGPKSFLVSTRSMAFKKSVWKKIGGFSDYGESLVEDAQLTDLLIKNNINIVKVKTANVLWMIPEDINEFLCKIAIHATWDAKFGTYWNSAKGWSTQNLRAFSITLRYAIGAALFLLGFYRFYTWIFLAILMLFYLYFISKKFKPYFDAANELCYATLTYILVDMFVIKGYLTGTIGRWQSTPLDMQVRR